MGNITSKSDVSGSSWTYHATKKHAVTVAGSNTYSYDANGNQTVRNGNSVVWTSYNYPSHIQNGTKYHDYYYDASRQRWKQVYFNGSSSETTIFVGGILEKRSLGASTEYRHYIRVGNEPVALYTRHSSGAINTRYFLLDHIGSIAEITESSGAPYVSESFAAFGGRRDPVDWSGPQSSADDALIAAATPRGYTFHTNLESSSLIHMNGRVMDSLTGRFLSADPYVADPQSTQGFNRYSYVYNNPLTYTEPSGFICSNPGGIEVCFRALASAVVFFADSIFGSTTVKLPPPNWCGIAGPKGCYGSVPSVLGRIIKDIFGLPSFPNRLTPGFGADTGWMLNFQDSANAGGNTTVSDSRPFKVDGYVDLDVYLDQLIEHLKKRTESLKVEVHDLSKDDERRRFGRLGKGFAQTQIGIMEGSLFSKTFVSTTNSGLRAIVEAAHPYKGKWKFLSPILTLLGMEDQYDVSGWDSICSGIVCGFQDPSGGFHPICDIAPPILSGPNNGCGR
ncbi:MAG: RHS repeat-associated core domain-containing protein [Woeseia sp.]